jgi:type II secretory pathway pseudopilin PulG
VSARSDRGFVLTELLLAMGLLVVILGATLTTFSTMERNSREASDLNDIQEQARVAVDRMAKHMRNLASRNEGGVRPIERALPDDVIFLAVNPVGAGTTSNPFNIHRVRYCVDKKNTLFVQTQTMGTASAAAANAAACPGPTGTSGWTTTEQLSTTVVNGERPVFGYMLAVPPPQRYAEVTSVTSDLQLEQVVGIRASLFVDDSVTRTPPETELTTRVFLRNQNRKPTATFTAAPFTGMSLQLNGSESEDPEGGRLRLEWFDNAKVGTDKKIGEGPVLVPSFTAGLHHIWLKVTDTSDNAVTTEIQSFNCQPTTGCVPV